MSGFEQLQMANHALFISFFRTKMGKEFDIANRLKKRFTQGILSPSYYTCYGQYDLIELMTIDSYEAIQKAPFDEDIIDCEFSLFYSWENFSYQIYEWAKGSPVLVLVLLKIQPALEKSLSTNIESYFVTFIKKTFADNANIFGGMGRNEFLLILRGKSFEKLLPTVSQVRQQLTLSKIMGSLHPIPADQDMPLFISSTTFPAVGHPYLYNKGQYNFLEGRILPRVYIVCHPGYEQVIDKNKPPSCTGSYNIYGKNDVLLTWNNPVAFAQFAEELSNFRNTISEIEGIKSTETTLLGIEEISNEKSYAIAPSIKRSPPNLLPRTQDILDKSIFMDSLCRAKLLEFLGRLNSCYTKPESKESFRDMIGIHHSILWGLDNLQNANVPYTHYLNTYLSELIDLCNNALYQRYAGLDTRFETSKHHPFPFLKGIDGYIAAATCIPCFIFKAILPDKPIHDIWPGFVVFGMSYSYQYLTGRILSYPASSLQRPIEDWWGITHEVAHAIYWIFEFYKKDLPPKIGEYFEKIPTTTPTSILLSIEIEEIYANWFDFKYIFGGDKKRYFTIIWKSWLRWNRVWRFREEYLLRSLMIFLTTDLKGLFEARNAGYPETEKYLTAKFEEMIFSIKSKVSGFDRFVAEADLQSIVGASKFIDKLEPFLNFLEDQYFEKEIYSRLHPPYPESTLADHIKCLESGLIINDNIPSPIKLLHRLYDLYPAMNKSVPIQTTAAVISTLMLKYVRDYRE